MSTGLGYQFLGKFENVKTTETASNLNPIALPSRLGIGLTNLKTSLAGWNEKRL